MNIFKRNTMNDTRLYVKGDVFSKQRTVFTIYKMLVFFSGLLLSFSLLFLLVVVGLVSSPLHQPFLHSDVVINDVLITRFLVSGDVFLFDSTLITDEEISHMFDVRAIMLLLFRYGFAFLVTGLLFWFVSRFLYMKGLLLAQSGLTLSKQQKIHSSVKLLFSLPQVLIIGLVLALVFDALFSPSNFLLKFEQFHQLFFSQGNYLFSSDSFLIQTYPASFFWNMTKLMVGKIVLLQIVLMLFAQKVLFKREKNMF